MYIHSFSNSSDLLWTKASDYVITQKKITSETIDFIQPSKDSKLIKYSPVFDSESKNNNFENPLSIDLDDLFKIDLEDEVSILNFYQKYGDIGLLSHKLKGYTSAARWLPTHELSSKSTVLSITPYQAEYFFDTSWKKRLKAVGEPLAIDKKRFPDVGKSQDSGEGEYSNKMKKLLGTLVRDENAELVGEVPELIFEDNVRFSQLKFEEDFGTFMGTYFPDLVLDLNDVDIQLVDFPLPYSIDYFKTSAEPLSEVKKVLKELIDSFEFSHNVEGIRILPQRPSFYMDENAAKSYYGRDNILSYLPKSSISPVKKLDSIGYRWHKSWIFKSLLSMFALKMRQELVK
tara:strand:+ start:151 stop:1185 length:1035 start_codon:yes stop_codon:yes gene_type:complete